MADYKNQHFVPKAHFKPFSIDGVGHAVNMYLVERERPVFGASIRGQCAKPYLYGKDGRLERLLGHMEARYSHLVSRLRDQQYRLTAEDEWLLRYFILLQSHRIAEQIERGFARMSEMASFFQKAEEAHGNRWDPMNNPTRELIMRELMLSVNEQMRESVLDDLKVVIVRNRTRHEFVTSDDPAVMTNRWLLQRKSINIFGTNAAGLIMFLPLGPTLLALLYDTAVYNVSAAALNKVDLTKETDVAAFNEHQYMRAVAAVYFRQKEDAARIASEFKAVHSFRPEAWDRFTVAKKDGGTATHTRYTVGTPDEVAKEDAILFHVAREWPSPPRWPSILRYRSNAVGFTKGRAIIRRAHLQNFSDEPGVYHRVK